MAGRPKKSSADKLEQVLQELEQSDPEKAQAVREAMASHSADKNLDMEARDEWQKQQKEPHRWIIIQRMPEDTEDYVFVGAAGVNYTIEKGKRVPVPKSVLAVLRNAEVKYQTIEVDEFTGRKSLKKVQYFRYPFSDDGEASPSEVADFKKKRKQIADRQAAGDQVEIDAEQRVLAS